jgi:hypothetical protein
MEVSVQLRCPCHPGFSYKSKESLNQHKRTKLHKMWEVQQENKHDKVRSKEFENENERLKRRLALKEDVETELLIRIHQLESEVFYWKKACEGVYVN